MSMIGFIIGFLSLLNMVVIAFVNMSDGSKALLIILNVLAIGLLAIVTDLAIEQRGKHGM